MFLGSSTDFPLVYLPLSFVSCGFKETFSIGHPTPENDANISYPSAGVVNPNRLTAISCGRLGQRFLPQGRIAMILVIESLL